MKVRELIDQLLMLDPELQVVTLQGEGEGGYYLVCETEVVTVQDHDGYLEKVGNEYRFRRAGGEKVVEIL